jgi:outer membrane protein TolC
MSTFIRNAASLGAALFLLLCMKPVVAGSSGLTLSETVRLAVQQAPTLDAQEARIEAARQDALRAGSLPDPMLTVGIDNLPVTGVDAFDPNADFMTMKKIGLRQEFPAAAEREAQRAVAARAVDEALALDRAGQLQVARAAAQAWVDAWAARRELQVLEKLREQARLAAELARARVRGGTASASEALGARAAVVELDNQLEAAKAAAAVAQAGLVRWLGTHVQAVSTEAPDFGVLPHSQAELLAALDRLGPLLPIAAQVESTAASVDLARARKHPDWSVAASYGQRSGGSDMLMVEVGIGLPLFTRNRQDRDVAARESEYRAALATREDQRRALAAQVRAGFARWESLKRQVALHEQSLLPLAADRSASALAAFRAGGPIAPWLDARRDELAAHLGHVEHLDALGRAWAELAFLLPMQEQP